MLYHDDLVEGKMQLVILQYKKANINITIIIIDLSRTLTKFTNVN